MTKQQVMEQVMAGHPMVVGKYVTSLAETIKWTDQKTGQSKVAPGLKHSILALGFVASVMERIETQGFDPLKYKAPYKPGQELVVTVRSITSLKGNSTIYGKIEVLEA